MVLFDLQRQFGGILYCTKDEMEFIWNVSNKCTEGMIDIK